MYTMAECFKGEKIMKLNKRGVRIPNKPGESAYCEHCHIYHIIGSDRYDQCAAHGWCKPKNSSLDQFLG